MQLWIAFELVSSSYWKQRSNKSAQSSTRCELLSNLYLRHIENNLQMLPLRNCYVVNCFRTCIFVILKTTDLYLQCQTKTLWIAFELVSSSYWKQPIRLYNGALHSCELLSNLYLRHIENNCVKNANNKTHVVNCFRTCIFVILKTTKIRTSFTKPCCELLSNLYLRHIENNRAKKTYWVSTVVNCFRTCIFVILKTTKARATLHRTTVVNCFRTCIFVILKTTRH